MRTRAVLAGMLIAGAFLIPAIASAAPAYMVSRGTVRAGPGTDYPTLIRLDKGNTVEVYGCLQGWAWCDVSWGAYRGWMYAEHLVYPYQGQRVLIPRYGPMIGLPILSFSFNYWDTHYRNRSFYRERDNYARRHPFAAQNFNRDRRPPPPPPHRPGHKPPPPAHKVNKPAPNQGYRPGPSHTSKPAPNQANRGNAHRPPPNANRGNDNRPGPGNRGNNNNNNNRPGQHGNR